MFRDDKTDFDKGDLKDDLKRAGFEDSMADNIADRVDDRKARGWTYATGRQEAVREAQMMIDSSKAALENFKAETDTARNQMTREREPTSREVVTKETY